MEIGKRKIAETVVNEHLTAEAMASGGLPVYATPGMVALMEASAYNLLKAEGLDSVGIEINVKHTRACKIGTPVKAEAEITAIDGKRISFSITASDDKGEIGSATHVRYLIDAEKFMGKLG